MADSRGKARDAAARAKALAARIMICLAEHRRNPLPSQQAGGDWQALEAAGVGIASLADAVLALADEADAMATEAIDARVKVVLRAACEDVLRDLKAEPLPAKQ